MSMSPSRDDRPMRRCCWSTGASPQPATAGAGERAALLQLERANGMLHERAPDAPVDFVMRLFAGAAAEDLLRYQPQELAELAAATWHFLAERAPRTAKIRVSNPDGGPRLDERLRHRARQRRHAVPRRLRDGRAQPSRPRNLSAGPSGIPRRPRCGRQAHPVRQRRRRRAAARKRHPGSRRPHRRRSREVRARECARRRRLRRAPRGAGLALDARPRRRHHRCAQDRPAAAPRGRGRRDHRLPRMAQGQQLHLPRHSRIPAGSRRSRAHRHSELDARRAARQPGRAGLGRRRPDRNVAAGAGRLRRAPPDADHQDQRALAGAPAGADGHDRDQAFPRRPAVGRRAGGRSVHLDRLHPLDPQHPLSPPQGRRRARTGRASRRTAIPAARSRTCSTPIPATSCSRSTRTRSSISR